MAARTLYSIKHVQGNIAGTDFAAKITAAKVATLTAAAAESPAKVLDEPIITYQHAATGGINCYSALLVFYVTAA